MKTVQFLGFFLIAAGLFSFSPASSPFHFTIQGENKGLVFKNEVINLGEIAKGKPVSVQFEFTNKGNEPIIIENVSTSCGCTVADYPKKPIEKNGKSAISVTYNAATAGAFNKAITVKVANEGTSVLYIKGNVKE
jgi:hypothetical protein